MGQAHSHSHGDAQSYFLEQLCTIGISAAVGGVSIVMYVESFGKAQSQSMLGRILTPSFHWMVLAAGIALVLCAVIKSVALWFEAGQRAHGHDHTHGPDCCHDHGPGGHGHDHTHGHDHGAHDHAHGHEHGHSHGPDCGHDHGPDGAQVHVHGPEGTHDHDAHGELGQAQASTAVAEHSPPKTDDHGHDHGWNPWRYAVLLLPIMLFFLGLPNAAGNAYLEATASISQRVPIFIAVFTGIFYEALPFIVLGAVLAGILEEFIPQRWVLRCIPRSRMLAIAMGAMLGLPFPMCECGILVIMRRLLRKGVPLSCCVAYMLAGPIINVVVMLSTYVAFSGGGLNMVEMRMGMGFLVAFCTGLIVEGQYRRHGAKLLAAGLLAKRPEASDDDPTANVTQEPLAKRIGTAAEVALHDFVDISVYLILGALLAALSHMVIAREAVAALSRNEPAMAILIMMGLAIVLCLCSEADAFVASSFVGMSSSAKLAFLVLGPMLDFKLYMMYLRVFRPRLIWTIITSVVVQVFSYTFLFHYAVLWLPTAFFFLDLPNGIFGSAHIDRSAFGAVNLADTGMKSVTPKGNGVINLGFKELEQAAYIPDLREEFEGKLGMLRGQIEYFPGRPKTTFKLVRMKMTCCRADAIKLDVPIISPEPLDLPAYQWVEVTGQIQFRKVEGADEYKPVLQLRSRSDVVPIPEETNPMLP